MVFNIQFQICGLVIVCMVMFFYFSNKTLKVSSEKTYSYLLVSVAICLILDITSILLINLKDFLPILFVNFICKAYTISITTVAFITRIYVMTSITHKPLTKQQKSFYFFPLAVDVYISIISPIHYHTEDGQIYSYGGPVSITYIAVTFYLLTSVYYLLRYRKKIHANHFAAISFLLVSWIFTATLQFFKNEWLLVGFAMAAAMAFMYFCLENPTQNLDTLTGMFNQSAYQRYIKNLHYQNKDFAVLVLSIDDMGFIAETFGTINAEAFLQEIAKYLDDHFSGKTFRDYENCFSLVLDNNPQEVTQLILAIQYRLEQPFKIADLIYHATVCIVEMDSVTCELEPENIIERSRYFMKKAIKQGKGTYLKVTREQILEKEKTRLVEHALRNAIQEESIQVFYQPIFSIEKNKYVSAEALARLTDANGNFIPPDVFIQVAEQNGMILELGMQIFKKVCLFIHTHPLKEMGIEYIEINLSVVQCMQERLAEELFAIMSKYNISPDFINLEITETAAANSNSSLKKNMDMLISKGVSFSLDDYGTGHSNLSYLMDFPVKLIKIDKSMVQSCFVTPKVNIAIEFTVSMVKKLGLKIVAEGIETKEQFARMAELKIDYIQGYYFSKPLNKVDFLKELDAKNLSFWV